MADGLYIGMSGAVARSQQLDAIADGLSNVQTPGYKSERPAFATVLASAGSPDRAYAAAVSTHVDAHAGPLQTTGNPLDVTPEGGAFLAVRTPSGQIAYTRDGRITLNDRGQLSVAGGLVLGQSGEPITVPAEATPIIDKDGTVSAEGVDLDKLARFQLHGALEHKGGSLYTAPLLEQVETAVHVGALELGNYSALDAAVGMVSAQRSFEHSMQVIETYKKLDDRANELGRVK